MSLSDIVSIHRSGKRLTRPKIDWLINELYKTKKKKQEAMRLSIYKCISIVDMYEDTEEIIDEIIKAFGPLLKENRINEQS